MNNEQLKNKLNEIKEENDNKLINFVIEDLLDADDLKNYFNDILNHGCIAGTVSSLIYYDDTVKFYESFKFEIQELINEFQIELHDLRDFDKEDNLILETHNQNLLAWLGFETVVYNLFSQLEI